MLSQVEKRLPRPSGARNDGMPGERLMQRKQAITVNDVLIFPSMNYVTYTLLLDDTVELAISL